MPYARLTLEDKLKLRWSQTTYNQFKVSEASFQILRSNEARDESAPASLAEANFRRVKSKLGEKSLRRLDTELANWVDGHTEVASFVLAYGAGESPPVLTLESPSDAVVNASQTSETLFYLDFGQEKSDIRPLIIRKLHFCP